ncbi:hypothetical protein RSOLAG22IIIB_05334 [Rhizoctonia solani]|uniref:Uncharacterized protein n=1 Tax=Rhizoctonia solani TaxID=456999 RepID=A0A0K6G527_9AGAM|nr:hypothetical protein RSOLAG22IIIB_05334 [Rhizoctonia solani]
MADPSCPVDQQATDDPDSERLGSQLQSYSNSLLSSSLPAVADSNASSVILDATSQPAHPGEGPDPHLNIRTETNRLHPILVEQALRDLRTSHYGMWIGNPHLIFRNCKWCPKNSDNSWVLSWKANSRFRPDDIADEVVVCWIDQGSSDGATLSPDSGWNILFKEEDIVNRKRTLCVIQGAKQLIESGYHVPASGVNSGTGYLFLDEQYGSLRARSPLFLPPPKSGWKREEGESELEEQKSGTQAIYCYDTWSFSSVAVREVFDKTMAAGFTPQVMGIFDRYNTLIHPNEVQSKVPGSIIIVCATLEKVLSPARENGGGRKWHFYANLKKAHVLKY